MTRRVTVTFDNGAQHTYENVPDSATPESVLERTRRDFGDRGVTNIDGGKEKGGLDYVMDVGKGLASVADTGLNAVTGALDYGAYALARAAGRSPEQAQAETTSPKDVIGGAFGITNDPAYQNEASRRAMAAVGSGIEKYAVKPLASATGLPEQDVANMVNTGMIAAAPGIARGAAATGRGAQAVGRGAVEAARAPVNFGKGFYEGVMNPEPTPNSAMVPLQKQAYPAQAGRDFMAGRMSLPELEASRVPSASLFGGKLDQAALKALPRNAEKQPMVPLAGRGMEAVGENLGRGYRTQPLQAAADLGLVGLGLPPIGPAARAAQGLASLRAGRAADFTPGFIEQVGAAQSQAALAPNPQLRLPAPVAPVAPVAAPQTMYAGAGGTSPNLQQAGQAALNVKYPPPQTRSEMVQQAAAERITRSPTQSLANTAKGQEIAAVLEQRRAAELAAKQQRWAAGGAKIPEAEPAAPAPAPVAAPAEPAAAPKTTLQMIQGRLKAQTPEEAAAVEAYNALTPAEKAAQTRAETAARKAPPGVSNMLTADPMDSWRGLNTRVETLPDGATVKRYPWNESKTIRVEEFDKSNPYGVNRDVVYRHEKTDTNYVERYRGARENPELLDRELYLPDTTITQRFATEMTDSGPRRTDQLTVQKGAKKDVYIDGQYSYSHDGRGSFKTAPQFGAMPDMDSLIRKFKDQ